MARRIELKGIVHDAVRDGDRQYHLRHRDGFRVGARPINRVLLEEAIGRRWRKPVEER